MDNNRHPYRRPVTQEQVLGALVQNIETLPNDVSYTLRMLVYQFYRVHEGTTTFADNELARLYGPDYGDELQAELTVEDSDAEAELQRNAESMFPSRGDRSPPDFPVPPLVSTKPQSVSCEVHSYDSSIRKPVSIECCE